MTSSTPSTMTRTTTTHAICTSEHSSTLSVVFLVSLMSSHDPLGSKQRMKLITKIGGKAPPHRGGNGKILGGIPHLRHHRDDGLDTDRTGKPEKSVKRLCMCGMSLTMNLVQNYSDNFGNSQRSSLSPTGCVKSTSSTTENGYENCIYITINIHMSDEDNKHDTNYINKHNDVNTDTRKLHL